MMDFCIEIVDYWKYFSANILNSLETLLTLGISKS